MTILRQGFTFVVNATSPCIGPRTNSKLTVDGLLLMMKYRALFDASLTPMDFVQRFFAKIVGVTLGMSLRVNPLHPKTPGTA
jgi:hypothetical protein